MPAILKIGYDYYLVKSEAAAIAALKALGDAIPMEQCYVPKAGYVYVPRSEKHRSHDGMELKIVKNSQLRRTKPQEEEDEPRVVKQLDFNGKVHQMPGGGA